MTNPAAATPGAPVESDAALRVRQAVSVALPSRTVLEGTVGAVASVPGVLRHVAYENDTAVADANGLPPHSIALVVDGGDAGLIASAIAAKKTPGTGTHGSTTVVVTDIYGIAHPIRFFRPVRVPVSAEIQMRALAGYTTATGQAVQRAVADYINGVAIGGGASASVEWADAISAANGVAGSGTFKITGLALSRSSGNSAPDVALAFNEAAAAAGRDQDHGKRVSDMANADEYLGLLSAYHRPRPRFGATVAAVCGAAAAVRDLYAGMPDAFDLDLAVGAQLDAVGCWIGLGAASPRRSPASTSRWTSTAWAWTRASGRALRSGQRPDRAGRRHVPAAAAGQNRRQPLGRHAGNLGRHPEPDLPGRHPRADRGQRRHVGGHRRGRRAAFGAVPGPADRGYIPIKPEGVRIKYYVLPRARGRCSVLTCRTNTSRGSTTDSGDRCLPVEFAGSIRKTLRGYQSNLSLRHRRRHNVLAPADYQALASRNAGFSAGTAKSKN